MSDVETDEMRRPVSGRDAVYAPKLSTCSEAQEIKETGNEKAYHCGSQEVSEIAHGHHRPGSR
jgi:hypothetical protein